MEARSGQSLDNKIALQVSFNPTAADIMDLLHTFVINKQYLFQRVSNYFQQHELFVFFNYTNTFFIHTMNYFSVVLPIIFLMCIENYFFIRRRIIFRGIANLFLGPQCFAGLAVGEDCFESFYFPWATILKTLKLRSAFKENASAKHCQGKKQKRFSSFLQNL